MVTYGVDPPNFVDSNERERERERWDLGFHLSNFKN